jgi:Na+/phosphate symporter
MKQIRFTVFLLALSAAALTLFSCAQPPKDEEKAANDAIAAARNAEAPDYASKEWSEANQTVTMAATKMENKDYDEAKKLFLEASEKARVAKETAEKSKAELNTELTRSKQTAQKAVEKVKTEFNKYHKKVSKESVATIEMAIKDAESNLAEATELIAGGKLMDAKAKLTTASSKADEATSALARAMTAKHKPMASKPTLSKKKK